ncbi:hypothetical protein BEI64_27610 [Eisenbergiella tayi]|nr:hypothetical protein BEI64_27610 [Eisenbergiella tayi]
MGISNTLYHINWKYVNRLRAKKRGWKGNGIKNRNGNCKNTGFTGSIRGTDNNSILEWVDRL